MNKRLYIQAGLLLLIGTFVVSQAQTPTTKNNQTPAARITEEKSAEESKTVTENVSKEENKGAIFDGFTGIAWGTTFNKVKDAVKGKIVYANEKKVIVTKVGEMTYRYGFFFQDIEVVGDMQAATPEAPETETAAEEQPEARLFYAVIEFPYLAMKNLKDKYVAKYGEPSAENIKKHRGVIIWESEKTLIIVWIDNYEDRSYSRKINYISKDISKELNSYYYKLFNKKELEILNKTLQP
jgi:hypothetical protein